MTRQFFKYVIQNVASMIGVSIYILADTFFISKAVGADGLTVLNLVLPIYGLIFAIGSMIGIGAATQYAIRKAKGEKEAGEYFSEAVIWNLIISIPFVVVGIAAPQRILEFMGADAGIAALGKDYIATFLPFAPFFMVNYVFTGFVRNDNAPTTAMIGAIAASLFNVVFDYIFMFPMNLGMKGAAMATACSPVVTILICSVHFLGKNSSFHIRWRCPSLKRLGASCQLGFSAFIGEFSSAVTTMVFNFLILRIAGNIGVAAYGIVANLSLVAMAVFNGISQGTQPLFSRCYGKGETEELKRLLRMGFLVTAVVEVVLIGITWGMTDFLVGIFNSQGNSDLLLYAHDGLRLYFLGYAVAGMNILNIVYFSATDRPRQAITGSLLRGVLAIVACAVIMATLFGMNGVWLSFLASEVVTLAVMLWMNRGR